jgi:hypothetical protein
MSSQDSNTNPPLIVNRDLWFPNQPTAPPTQVRTFRQSSNVGSSQTRNQRFPSHRTNQMNFPRERRANPVFRPALVQLDRNTSLQPQNTEKTFQPRIQAKMEDSNASTHQALGQGLSPLRRGVLPAQRSMAIPSDVDLARFQARFASLHINNDTDSNLSTDGSVATSTPVTMTLPQAGAQEPVIAPQNSGVKLDQAQNLKWPRHGQHDLVMSSAGVARNSLTTQTLPAPMSASDILRNNIAHTQVPNVTSAAQSRTGLATSSHAPVVPITGVVPRVVAAEVKSEVFSPLGTISANASTHIHVPTGPLAEVTRNALLTSSHAPAAYPGGISGNGQGLARPPPVAQGQKVNIGDSTQHYYSQRHNPQSNTVMYGAQGIPGGFRPMRRVLADAVTAPDFTPGAPGDEGTLASFLPPGTSPNYRGNPFLSSNQSADIQETDNCAVWITNLPPECTVNMLLSEIRNCGKVYATVINPPSANSNHTTAAAKVVFFARPGVDRLIMQARTGMFAVGGYVPRVCPNRIRSAAKEAGPQCRVLHIEGPTEILSIEYLTEFFQGKFSFEIDSVTALYDHGGYRRLEWRFGSYRCQAETARQAITREKMRYELFPEDSSLREMWAKVQVYFGVDPCA